MTTEPTLNERLEALTPGGSEFYDNPDACLRYILRRLASQQSLLARQAVRLNSLDALLAAAQAVLSYPARGEKVCLADIADDPCTCRGHDALAALRAAIAAATEGPSGGRTPEGEKEERT